MEQFDLYILTRQDLVEAVKRFGSGAESSKHVYKKSEARWMDLDGSALHLYDEPPVLSGNS